MAQEFGTYGKIRGLSGGQKVKLVLAAAMWNVSTYRYFISLIVEFHADILLPPNTRSAPIFLFSMNLQII